MRKSKFTESQIVAILAEGDAGLPVGEVCRKHGISNALYYQWKSKYSGVSVNELKWVREFEGIALIFIRFQINHLFDQRFPRCLLT
jgi:putative transposase